MNELYSKHHHHQLEPVLKPNVSRFSINFERLFGKILPLYSTYCKKFCQKTSQNLWKSEARSSLKMVRNGDLRQSHSGISCNGKKFEVLSGEARHKSK